MTDTRYVGAWRLAQSHVSSSHGSCPSCLVVLRSSSLQERLDGVLSVSLLTCAGAAGAALGWLGLVGSARIPALRWLLHACCGVNFVVFVFGCAVRSAALVTVFLVVGIAMFSYAWTLRMDYEYGVKARNEWLNAKVAVVATVFRRT